MQGELVPKYKKIKANENVSSWNHFLPEIKSKVSLFEKMSVYAFDKNV